jgi:uncharacterized protein
MIWEGTFLKENMRTKTKTPSSVALDTNILIYATDRSSPYFEKAQQTIERIRSGEVSAVITLQVINEMYAILTSSKRIKNVLSPKQAWKDIENILNSGLFRIVFPNKDTLKVLGLLVKRLQPVSQKIHDLALAATLISNDVPVLLTVNINDFKDIPQMEIVTL